MHDHEAPDVTLALTRAGLAVARGSFANRLSEADGRFE
jgi:hypothetical protein